MELNWLERITDHLDELFIQATAELSTEIRDAARLISPKEYEACSEDVYDVYQSCDRLLLRAWVRGLFGEIADRPEIHAAASIPGPYRSALLRYSYRKIALAYADGEATAKAFRRLCP